MSEKMFRVIGIDDRGQYSQAHLSTADYKTPQDIGFWLANNALVLIEDYKLKNIYVEAMIDMPINDPEDPDPLPDSVIISQEEFAQIFYYYKQYLTEFGLSDQIIH